MKELIERLREGKKANAPYETDYAIPPTKLNREAADALERLTAERDVLFNRATTAEFETAALRADAERYRWLNNNPEWLGWEHDFRPDEVERELDAAIAGEKK